MTFVVLTIRTKLVSLQWTMPSNANSGKLSLLVVAIVVTPLVFYYKFYISGGYSSSSARVTGAGVKMSSLDVLAKDIPEELGQKIDQVVEEDGYADINVRIGMHTPVEISNGRALKRFTHTLQLHACIVQNHKW